MTKQVPEGYMRDAQDRLVPIETVRQIDLERDAIVREIVGKAELLAGQLAGFKKKTMDDIQAFIELSAEKFNVKLGGIKGNVNLLTFDGEYRITRAMNENIVFDERLQIAKQLIDECITDWSAGSRAELRALINDAFYVDKQGKINTQRVLGLRRLDIKDDKWQKAMDAIGESLQVADTKAYIRIYKRNQAGEYKLVNLDVAA
ncbi:MAG: sulfate transporter [Spirochaetes bacterium GWB1_59_5]|nr:MAG: sulfate transporter [Spirochaetes bacterium GWB1_59_5]